MARGAGRSFGRFSSGSIDAYDLMANAKTSGAELLQEDDKRKYLEDLRAYNQRKSKKGFFRGLLDMGMTAGLNMLIPGGSTIMSMITAGMARGALSEVGGDAFSSMLGISPESVPGFKASQYGPYGRKSGRKLKQWGSDVQQQYQDQARSEKRNEMFTSFLSGFAPEFKELTGQIGGKLKSLFGEGSLASQLSKSEASARRFSESISKLTPAQKYKQQRNLGDWGSYNLKMDDGGVVKAPIGNDLKRAESKNRYMQLILGGIPESSSKKRKGK